MKRRPRSKSSFDHSERLSQTDTFGVADFLKDPYKIAGELYHTFKYIKDLGWGGVKTAIKSMLSKFVQIQGDRLGLLLGAEAEDPVFLAYYLGGYFVGYIGEQVAVAILTAGVAKVGLVGKALARGAQAADDLIAIAKAAAGPAADTAEAVQKLSKGFANDFARAARSADEARAARRNASLCRSINDCLVAGTLVVMADGSLKAIDDIRTNDMVLADDPTDVLPPRPHRVLGQIRNSTQSLYRISWDVNGDAAPDASVRATSEHPFWTMESGWRVASALTPGMTLRDKEGKSLTVCSIVKTPGATVTFNIDVEGPNTFFVAANGSTVLLHNLEGDVYLFNEPFRGKGQSQVFTSKGVPIFNPDGSPLIQFNPQHHFHFDAWLKRNFTTYTSRISPFPCIELTYEQHVAAHAAGEVWLKQRFGKGSSNMNAKWLDVSVEQMNELAEHMMAAARAKGAVINDIKVGTLKNWCNATLADHAKYQGCRW